MIHACSVVTCRWIRSASLLYLQKTTGITVASPGDFVPYTLRIENSSAVVQTAITVTDWLPAGFRLMPGSTTINDTLAPDPAIGPDGRLLSITIGDLGPGMSVTVRYVTEITVGAKGKTAINTASASSATGVQSNAANATLQTGRGPVHGQGDHCRPRHSRHLW